MRARVASVAYLNALPLTWGLSHGRDRGLFEIGFHSPAQCARLLQDGMVDLALIPSVEFERIRGLQALPGLGVVSRREVRSVILLTRSDPQDIRSLALDTNSRTSAALVQVLLARRYGVRPTLHPMAPDAEEMLRRYDAGLMIGDAALRVTAHDLPVLDGRPLRVLDLAAEWHAMTCLPFVFAFWACRPVVDAPALREVLGRSLAEGLESIDAIAQGESGRTGIPPAAIAAYLRFNIQYRMGPEEGDSLRLFFRLCREEGLIPGYGRPALPASRSFTVNRG